MPSETEVIPLKQRSASLSWTLAAAATSFAVGCTLGPTGTSFTHEDAAVPNLSGDSGVTAKCVNLECSRASCPGGRHTTLSGTVYDPAGQSPLYNAIVYVPNGPVKPFVPGVSCDHCGTITSGDPMAVTLTDEHGRFVVDDVPVVESLPVVIQIGRWRRLITVDHVEACADNPIPVTQTHLPRNQREGDIPLFAVVTGGFDPLECLMRKIGVDDEEFTGSSGQGRVHLFEGWYGGGLPSSQPSETLYPQIDRYDAVLLACEGDTYPQNKPEDAVYAMADYLNRGGRVYASHFQYYWFAPFPDGAGADPLPSVAVWDQRAAMNDTIDAIVDVGFPKGKAYYDWLSNAGAIGHDGLLTVQQARHDVDQSVPPLSQSWIHTNTSLGDPTAVQMLTFNTPITSSPDKQCGRVAFSDMHVASQDITGQTFPTGCVTKGLTSQEKALEFMIFDLSSCIQEDTVPPIAPSSPLK
jgi:hypothetical protein